MDLRGGVGLVRSAVGFTPRGGNAGFPGGAGSAVIRSMREVPVSWLPAISPPRKTTLTFFLSCLLASSSPPPPNSSHTQLLPLLPITQLQKRKNIPDHEKLRLQKLLDTSALLHSHHPPALLFRCFRNSVVWRVLPPTRDPAGIRVDGKCPEGLRESARVYTVGPWPLRLDTCLSIN